MKFLAVVLIGTFLTFSLHSFAQKIPIDVEMVRKELLSKGHISPDDFIRQLKPGLFNVMYAGDLCFVHLPYKNYAGEAFMQSSDMVVYRLSEDKWTFESLLPAWYNNTLLDSTQFVFLADVKFCDAKGSCQTYQSLSKYDGKELLILREYNGVDKKIYYDWLKDNGKPEELKAAVGQTIRNMFILSDFRFEQHQLSFKLNRKSETISSISKDAVRKKVVLDDFQRVIANY